MHIQHVMNLGVLYEDRGDYERAIQCYQSVLDYFPGTAAPSFTLKDAQASLTMFYDEDAARREGEGRPESSVSPVSRNLLLAARPHGACRSSASTTRWATWSPRAKRICCRSRISAARSLRELKEFLSSKGLSLASASGPGGIVEPAAEEAPVVAEGPVSEETLKKNLSDFEWSGRIRKVYEKMGRR